MNFLPEEYKLIEFFETEPELIDGDAKPWEYNELLFTTNRGEDTVIAKIYPPRGKLSLTWEKAGCRLLKMKLIELDRLTVELQPNNEFLTATGEYLDQNVLLKLRLKPLVTIEFEQH